MSKGMFVEVAEVDGKLFKKKKNCILGGLQQGNGKKKK